MQDGETHAEANSFKRRRTGSGSAEVIAYLGPQGTYGHQVAMRFHALLPSTPPTRLEPCPTISAVLTHPTARHKIIPLENSLYGSVTETLDTLLRSSFSTSSPDPAASSSVPSSPSGSASSSLASSSRHALGGAQIVGEITLRIQHVLVARRGVSLEDVRWVRSHEQALGQCKRFLSTRMPHAQIQKWASTAGAAASLLSEQEGFAGQSGSGDEPDTAAGAAICSRAALDALDRLDIIAEDVQDNPNNYTRFLVLSRDPSLSELAPPGGAADPTSFWALPTLSDLAHPHASRPAPAPLVAAYSRPAPPDPRQPQVRTPKWYIVEYAGNVTPGPDTTGVYLGVSSWRIEVNDAAERNGSKAIMLEGRSMEKHA